MTTPDVSFCESAKPSTVTASAMMELVGYRTVLHSFRMFTILRPLGGSQAAFADKHRFTLDCGRKAAKSAPSAWYSAADPRRCIESA